MGSQSKTLKRKKGKTEQSYFTKNKLVSCRRRSFKRKARCLKFYRLQDKQRSKEVEIKSRMIGGVGSARLRRWSNQSSTLKMFFSSVLLLVTRKNHRQEKARK